MFADSENIQADLICQFDGFEQVFHARERVEFLARHWVGFPFDEGI
jgi:hypothetical protein